MSRKLKPCPFCGGEAELRKWAIEGDILVWCKSCGAETKSGHRVEAITTAWNTRADSWPRVRRYPDEVPPIKGYVLKWNIPNGEWWPCRNAGIGSRDSFLWLPAPPMPPPPKES